MSENGYCLQEKIEDSECWLCGGMGCDAEMFDATGTDADGESQFVHAECGLGKGWEVA